MNYNEISCYVNLLQCIKTNNYDYDNIVIKLILKKYETKLINDYILNNKNETEIKKKWKFEIYEKAIMTTNNFTNNIYKSLLLKIINNDWKYYNEIKTMFDIVNLNVNNFKKYKNNMNNYISYIT